MIIAEKIDLNEQLYEEEQLQMLEKQWQIIKMWCWPNARVTVLKILFAPMVVP